MTPTSAETAQAAMDARSVRRQIDPIPQSPYKELQIGPDENLDEAAALGSDLGSAKKSHQIIRAVANMYPQELRTAASLPIDHNRSACLDENDDELEKLARPLLQKGQSVVPGSGRVRGRRSDERIVSFLIQTESGRTGRAILPYERFEATEETFDDAPGFEQVSRDRAEIDRGDPRSKKGSSSKDSKDARAAKRAERETAELRERLEAAEAELEEARKAREEAEAKAESAEESAEGAQERASEAESKAADPPPIEDYEDVNARQFKDRVSIDSHGREGVVSALAYEESHKNRKGVVDYLRKLLSDDDG